MDVSEHCKRMAAASSGGRVRCRIPRRHPLPCAQWVPICHVSPPLLSLPCRRSQMLLYKNLLSSLSYDRRHFSQCPLSGVQFMHGAPHFIQRANKKQLLSLMIATYHITRKPLLSPFHIAFAYQLEEYLTSPRFCGTFNSIGRNAGHAFLYPVQVMPVLV